MDAPAQLALDLAPPASPPCARQSAEADREAWEIETGIAFWSHVLARCPQKRVTLWVGQPPHPVDVTCPEAEPWPTLRPHGIEG